jgi:hypothetical protein
VDPRSGLVVQYRILSLPLSLSEEKRTKIVKKAVKKLQL